MIKNIFSKIILHLAKIYQRIFYPLFYFYYKAYFSRRFRVSKLKVSKKNESNSFLFLVEDKKNGEKYFFKKYNFLANLYDLFFIGYKKKSPKKLRKELRGLKEKDDLFRKIVPQVFIFKKIFLDKWLGESYFRLDYFIKKNPSNKEVLGFLYGKIFYSIKRLNDSGYIHGDVKAKNIFVDDDKNIKIIDWDGLRRLREKEKNLDILKLDQVFIPLLGRQKIDRLKKEKERF